MTTLMGIFDTTIFFILGALVLGLMVGSFLNVVIYRFPISLFAGWRKECREFLAENKEKNKQQAPEDDETFNIAFPRSHCPQCKAQINAWQNIPLVSYLLLKGRCKHCDARISPRYPIVELLTGLLSAFIVAKYGLSYESGLILIFTWSLLVLTLIDIDHQLLPDHITLPLMWLGLAVNTVDTFTDLRSAVFGAMFGYLILWGVYWLFKLVTGKEGMGFGDFKLLAALGAWMGWQQLPVIIILSSLVGAVIGIAGIIIAGRDKNIPIPFGPYLAIAGWIAFFWGSDIIQLYLSYSGM